MTAHAPVTSSLLQNVWATNSLSKRTQYLAFIKVDVSLLFFKIVVKRPITNLLVIIAMIFILFFLFESIVLLIVATHMTSSCCIPTKIFIMYVSGNNV